MIDATNRVFHEHVPYSHDERIFRPDGSLRYLHTWAYPVLDDAGRLTRLVGVCQDITDRKLAEGRCCSSTPRSSAGLPSAPAPSRRRYATSKRSTRP